MRFGRLVVHSQFENEFLAVGEQASSIHRDSVILSDEADVPRLMC